MATIADLDVAITGLSTAVDAAVAKLGTVAVDVAPEVASVNALTAKLKAAVGQPGPVFTVGEILPEGTVVPPAPVVVIDTATTAVLTPGSIIAAGTTGTVTAV